MKYKYNNKWNELYLKQSGDTLPIGTIAQYGGSTAPANWLICDGSAISRTTYKLLFDAIGTTYGTGDGSTTFNLPDFRGKIGVGKSSDTEFNSLGKTGGEKTHTLVANEMPKHTHRQLELNTTNSGSWARVVNAAADKAISSAYTTYNGIFTGEAGNDQPHNNLQPYLVTNYIIKYSNSIGLVGNVVTNMDATGAGDVPNAKTIKDYIISHGGGGQGAVEVNLDGAGNTILLDNYITNDGLYHFTFNDQSASKASKFDNIDTGVDGPDICRNVYWLVENFKGDGRIYTYPLEGISEMWRINRERTSSTTFGKVYATFKTENFMVMRDEEGASIAGSFVGEGDPELASPQVNLWIDPTEDTEVASSEVVDRMDINTGNFAPSVNAVKDYINGVVLYNNDAGNGGTITLSDNVNNYNTIEVICGANDRYQMQNLIFPHDQRSFTVMTHNVGDNSALVYISTKNYAVSDTTISIQPTNRYAYYEVSKENKIVNYLTNRPNDIVIYRVIGHK